MNMLKLNSPWHTQNWNTIFFKGRRIILCLKDLCWINKYDSQLPLLAAAPIVYLLLLFLILANETDNTFHNSKVLWILIGTYLLQLSYFTIRARHKEKVLRRKLACDLHDDLGNTLICLKTFTQLALEQERKEYLHLINENANDAICAVRSMIWILDEQQSSVSDLLNQIKKFASFIPTDKEIVFEVGNHDALSKHMLTCLERKNLFLIVKEVISNSIKYSDAGRVLLYFSICNKNPYIQIADNGKGFEVNSCSKGNGLNNISFRAKEIGYKMEIESRTGYGTTIALFRN